MPVPRRDVLRMGLVAAAAAGLSACTRASNGGLAPTDPGGPQDPDRELRAQVGADESRLVALYAAAAAVLPAAVAAHVTDLGTRHAAYRQAIDPDGLATSSPSGASTSSGASPAASAPTEAPAVTAATALRVLRDAESAAASARATQSASAADPSLARVLVLAGAGSASAAAVLASRALR